MGLLNGGRPTVLDLGALGFATLLGYGWAGIPGAGIFGGSLLALFALIEFYILRPAERLKEFEERISEVEENQED